MRVWAERAASCGVVLVEAGKSGWEYWGFSVEHAVEALFIP